MGIHHLILVIAYSLITVSAQESTASSSPASPTSASSQRTDLEFFTQCSALGDASLKATMCYDAYRKDMSEGEDAYCCPNWRLANCLIQTIGPGCSPDARGKLHDYWQKDFFGNSSICTGFHDYLTDGYMPPGCTWYYHKWQFVIWIFLAVAVVILILSSIIIMIRLRKARQRAVQLPASQSS
jgi:hypothetical protein